MAGFGGTDLTCACLSPASLGLVLTTLHTVTFHGGSKGHSGNSRKLPKATLLAAGYLLTNHHLGWMPGSPTTGIDLVLPAAGTQATSMTLTHMSLEFLVICVHGVFCLLLHGLSLKSFITTG